MKFGLSILALSLVPTCATAVESYNHYFETLNSGSTIIDQFSATNVIADFEYSSAMRYTLSGALSPTVYKSLVLAVDFTKFQFDVPRPMELPGSFPTNAEFTIDGRLIFSKKGYIPEGYPPEPFSFKVNVVCTDFCESKIPANPWGEPSIKKLTFTDIIKPNTPYYPPNFSIAIDSFSYNNQPYHLENLRDVRLSLNWNYSGELQTKTMTHLVKASGYSLDKAGRSQVARGDAMDSLLSKASLAKTLSGLGSYVKDGKMTPEGMVELKLAQKADEEYRTIQGDILAFAAAQPDKSNQEYAVEVLTKMAELSGDAMAVRMAGGKTDVLDAARAANLVAMSLNLSAAATGNWIYNDPPDYNYNNLDWNADMDTAITHARLKIVDAYNAGLLLANGSLEGTILQAYQNFVSLAAAGTAYERYSGAFLSGDLELANMHFGRYRLTADLLAGSFANMSNGWSAAAQQLRHVEIPEVSADELEAAKSTLRAAISFLSSQGTAARVADDAGSPTVEELRALLRELEAFNPADLKGLTMLDLAIPNYAQLSLDHAAAVPEASTTALLVVGMLALCIWSRRRRSAPH